MVEPITTTAAIVKGVCWICTALGFGYCAKKAHDAYNEHSENVRKKLDLQGKSMEEARKENELLNSKNKELEEKLRHGENRQKDIEEQIGNVRKQLQDPKTTEKEKEELRSKLAFLTTQLDEIKRSNENYRNEIDRNNQQMERNSDTITNIGSNSGKKDKHWIWNFLTLENVIIMGGVIMLYKILKDDKDKK